MPTKQPTGAIVDRLRNNSSQDWRWVVPWALFNDSEEHSSREIIEAAADAIESKQERTCHLIRTHESYRGGGGVSVRCSACGKALPKRLAERWTILFCPKCGAKVVDHAD